LWKGFSSKLRSQIRRATKAGLEARFGLDQMEPFYSVFSRNMRDLGTPVMPRAWFESIARIFPQIARFGVVYHGSTPVAAGCGFVWRDEFEMTWASSLREFNHLAPNMLLYCSFMEQMIHAGVRRFNFGRCTAGGGTHRFKTQWGGIDEPLPWGQWSPAQIRTTPSPERPAYRMAAAVWRRLPLNLTNRVGPVLARVIP
jgi:lipid II:glycine glycyltransferase (peptidoglycan interpeptide bridge formation enzyme)